MCFPLLPLPPAVSTYSNTTTDHPYTTSPSTHPLVVVLFPSQNNASKLLLAIMESRHDSENAERILYNMRPKELVSDLHRLTSTST